MPKKIGRRKGARSKGFFFREGRGWVTKAAGRFIPLTDADGRRLRDRGTAEAVLKEAYARQLLALPMDNAPDKVPESAVQVGAVCGAYLDNLRAQAGDLSTARGLAKTYLDRGETLFDFCYGLPAQYFCGGDREKRHKKLLEAEAQRIHSGFGQKLCTELTPADIDAWLNAHAWKPGGRRTRVQAVKRALNFGVERKMVAANPIRGYKLPPSTSRVTYLTPEQEGAMISVSSAAFALALQVCIRTGARFGCEFAALTARQVRDHGDRMEWVFKPEESKTKKQRIIRIMDQAVVDIVRQKLKEDPKGPIFRNVSGEPWSRERLSQNFRRAKAKLKARGIVLDEDACMYSCRHTYAKRTLEGYWTGKPTSIQTLARLMGNSVQVCIAHYLQFSHADNEMLWAAC